MKSRYKEKLKTSKAHEDYDNMKKKFFSTGSIKQMSQITNDNIFNNADMIFNMSYSTYDCLLRIVLNYFYDYMDDNKSTISPSPNDILLSEILDVMEKKNTIIRVSDEETIKKCGHSFEISTCFDLSKYYKDDKYDEFKPSVMVATNANLIGINRSKEKDSLIIHYTGEITVGAHKYKISSDGENDRTQLIADTAIKINGKPMVLSNEKYYSKYEINLMNKTEGFTNYNAILSQILCTIYNHITPNDKPKIFNTKILNGVSYIDVNVDYTENDERPIIFIDYLLWHIYGKLGRCDTREIYRATKLMSADISKSLSEIDDIMKIDDSSIDKFIDLWKGNDYDTPPYETFDIPMQGVILEYNDMVIKFSTNVVPEDDSDMIGVMEIRYLSTDFVTRLPIIVNKETMVLRFPKFVINKEFCKRILKAWYGIQVALRHPAIRTIVERDCIINDSTEIDVSMPKEKRHVTTYYNMTGERVEYVLSGGSGSGRHFKRHTMSWYVIGHWRKIGEDKKTFVKGHWRGPLRDMLSTEPHRERELKEVKV